jgi:hypothetical protein
MHAELHEGYRPKPRDPRADEARRIADSIAEHKQSDPSSHIYDSLVDQLITNSLQLAKANEPDEPAQWTAPQRVVWRSADGLSRDQRWQVIHDQRVSSDIKAFAEVNNARWLVRCVLRNKDGQICHGAQYASWLDRKFFCVSCFNSQVDSKWLEVVWPSNVSEIERILSERPESARHWLPGETVTDLTAQNSTRVSSCKIE